MTASDLTGMSWDGSMGIKVTLPIPSEKIVDNVIVPRDYETNGFTGYVDDLLLEKEETDLLAALSLVEA
jgi:hypothetical protein